jgi:hypothetical protein
MPVSTTARASTYRSGLLATEVTGIGLSGTAVDQLQRELEQTQTLLDAITLAVDRARAAAVNGFNPDSAFLDIPAELSTTTRSHNGLSMSTLDFLFSRVIQRPFEELQQLPPSSPRITLYAGLPDYGALSLHEWSDAAQKLEQYLAQARSRLPTGLGGGITMDQGVWYVNGERFNMAELFVAVRMGNFVNTEAQMSRSIEQVNTNNRFARDVLAMIVDMTRFRAQRARDVPDKNIRTFDAGTGFQEVVETTRDGRTYEMSDLEKLAARFPNSSIKLAAEAARSETTLTLVEYVGTIDEMQKLFDTLNAENQVAQLKTESIQSVRSNLLESIANMLKSFRAEVSAVRRHLT